MPLATGTHNFLGPDSLPPLELCCQNFPLCFLAIQPSHLNHTYPMIVYPLFQGCGFEHYFILFILHNWKLNFFKVPDRTDTLTNIT